MPKLRRERDKTTGRFLKGNSAALRHSGYSSISKDIPLLVRRQAQAIREQLIRDIAGAEPELTAAQVILIDKTVNLYQVTLCLEAYVRREGPFRGKKLDPVLGQNYLAYVNTIRLNLRELGITKKAGDEILTPLQIAAEIDAEKEKRARSTKAKERKDPDQEAAAKAQEAVETATARAATRPLAAGQDDGKGKVGVDPGGNGQGGGKRASELDGDGRSLKDEGQDIGVGPEEA